MNRTFRRMYDRYAYRAWARWGYQSERDNVLRQLREDFWAGATYAACTIVLCMVLKLVVDTVVAGEPL